MKKHLIVFFASALLLTAIFFSACAPKPKDVDVQKLYEQLVDSGKLSLMIRVPENEMSEIFGIDTSKLKQYVFYMSENSSVNADEVAIFEVSEPEYAAELNRILSNRINRQRDLTSSYNPAEFEKLKPVEVYCSGNYVYYVVGSDYSGMLKILKANIG